MRSRLFAVGATAAMALGLAPRASAQVTGFAVQRFEPAERGSQFFVVDSLDLRGHGRPAVGAVFDYAYKSLVVYDLAGNERSALVRHQAFLSLGSAMVLWDRLRLAANAPFAIHQDGEASSLDGVRLEPPTSPAIGDLRLAADVRLVGDRVAPLTLAVGVRAWVPTGSARQFTGDGVLRAGPQALVAGNLGLVTYGARLGLTYRRPEADTLDGVSLRSELIGAVGVGLRTTDGRFVVGPELFASSNTASGAFLTTRGTPAEWLLGAHYDAAPGLRLGAGAGGGLVRGYGSPEVRCLLSIEWVPAYEKPDRDADGIHDEVDACPDEPGAADGDPQMHGCPPPRPDSDRDGIVDVEDACPERPGPRTTNPSTSGCPVVERDADGDGVPDRNDACPEAPGPRSADPVKSGCPLAVVTEKEIQLAERVQFKLGSDELLPESEAVLEAVFAVLVTNPSITRVQVEGHTDDVGAPDYNMDLSTRRAVAVTKWLTAHGIDASRLVPRGFGMEAPIDVNSTEEGRARNRRVAFTIHTRDDRENKPQP